MSTTTITAEASFDDAVELLYASFRDELFRPDMARCGHCVTDADIRALAADVRHLDPGLVGRFITKTGTTWGRSEDLRRVTPRALHLAAEQALPVNRSVLLHKLAGAGWSDWPAHQIDAVCRFLLAEWARLLSSPPRPGHAAHRWMRQSAGVMADLGPFLDIWQRSLADGSGTAAVHLSVLLVNSELRPDFPVTVEDLFDSHPASALSPTAPTVPVPAGSGPLPGAPGSPPARDGSARELADQFRSWLAGPVTEANLVRASNVLAHTPDARRLSLAVDRLRRFRAASSRGS